MVLSALEKLNSWLPAISPLQGVAAGRTQQVSGGNPFAVGMSNSGTGEIISNYGDGGAYSGAYKGVGGPVGQKFDTLRDLGMYGF